MVVVINEDRKAVYSVMGVSQGWAIFVCLIVIVSNIATKKEYMILSILHMYNSYTYELLIRSKNSL